MNKVTIDHSDRDLRFRRNILHHTHAAVSLKDNKLLTTGPEKTINLVKSKTKCEVYLLKDLRGSQH